MTSGGGGGGPGAPLSLELVAVEEEAEELDALPLLSLRRLRGGMLAKIMTAVRRRAAAIRQAAMMPPWSIFCWWG